MKKKKNFLLFVCVLAFALLLCGCGKTEKAAETFTIGLDCVYAPYNWSQTNNANGAVAIKDGSGYCGGYDVEIAKQIAASMGKELVIVKTDWEGLIPALNAGKVDAVFAGMSPTAERKFSVDFSDPYYESKLVIVVKADGPYADADSLDDFDGAKIVAQLNTFHDTVVDQIPNVVHMTPMETFPDMIIALQSGKVDGYISERPVAVSVKASNPDLTFVDLSEENGFVTDPEDVTSAIAVKKGSPILEDINKGLQAISEDERQELMEAAVANQPVLKSN